VVLPSISAEDESDNVTNVEAEVNLVLKDQVPPVQTSNWTEIPILVEDAFGLNWDYLQDRFGIFLRNFLWPRRFMFGPEITNFYGYSALEFDVEVISGNEEGWFFQVNPSTIDKTTGPYPGYDEPESGMVDWNHEVVLRAQVDQSAADYSIVVGLKCTRVLPNGERYGSSYCYIPLRADQYNLVQLVSTNDRMQGAPRSIVHLSIDVKNRGYYEDVFKFSFETDDSISVIADNSGAVIEPGETKTIDLSVMLPERLFDPGTPSTIDVYVTSTGDPSKAYVGRVIVVTQGMYLSQPILILLILVIGLILFFAFFFVKLGAKKEREVLGKPDKPWNLPEEKQHLESLKKKDPKAYEKELGMMKDEYESSLLWYRSLGRKQENTHLFDSFFSGIKKQLNSNNGTKKKKKIETSKEHSLYTKLFKVTDTSSSKTEKKQKKQTTKSKESTTIPQQSPEPKKPIQQTPPDQNNNTFDVEQQERDSRKTKAMKRILKQENKQRKKLKNSFYTLNQQLRDKGNQHSNE